MTLDANAACPGGPAAKADTEQPHTGAQLSALPQAIERQRNAGCTGIAIAAHIFIEFFCRGRKLFDTVVDNALVCLMADDPVDVIQGQSGFGKNTFNTAGNRFYRKYGWADCPARQHK